MAIVNILGKLIKSDRERGIGIPKVWELLLWLRAEVMWLMTNYWCGKYRK